MQKELFEDLKLPKKTKRRIQSILPRNYIPLKVTYEQIIFLVIANIMLLVLIFSLGVERGRHLSMMAISKPDTFQPRRDTTVIKRVVAEKAQKEKNRPKKVDVKTITDKAPVSSPQYISSVPDKKDTNQILSKQFTIQVVAYRSKKLAQRELAKLNKKGYKPFIIIGGGYYQICVGEYSSRDEAREDWIELRRFYKDSFVRKR